MSNMSVATSSPETDFPAVFRNRVKDWKIVNYSKEDWCNVFKGKTLKFRQGKRAFTQTPFWEQMCTSNEMTLDEFFERSTKNSDEWLYFDYKYLRDVFPDKEAFVKEIKWSDLNLVGVDIQESALWIGSKGAHTPCHKDTYGYNVVAQLFGRKLWILMPPEEGERLQAVRVPYEESSVYSGYNFFTPNYDLLKVENAFKVVLNPGDVLYVPRHWWHYVENLEPAISINIWVPLAEDYESRLEESLVQHYVSVICKDIAEEDLEKILNPNSLFLMKEPCELQTVMKCLEWYRMHANESRNEVEGIRQDLEGVNRLEKLDLKSYIEEKIRSYNYNPSEKGKSGNEISDAVSLAKVLINAYCQPSNITALKNSLLGTLK